jgi:hypothetical protein
MRGKRSCTVHLLLFNDLLVEADEEKNEPSKRLTIKIWDSTKSDNAGGKGGSTAELVLRQVIELGDGVEATALADTRKERHGFKVTSTNALEDGAPEADTTSTGDGKGKEPLRGAEGEAGPVTITVFAKTEAERTEWIKLIGQGSSHQLTPSSSYSSLSL